MQPHLWIAIASMAALALACSDAEPDEPVALAENIYAPLGEPRPDATPTELEAFERGERVLLRRFTPGTGLGPTFNVTFCGACHERPVPGGSAGRYRNFLIVGQKLQDGSFVTTGINGIQPQFTLGEEGRAADAEGNVQALRNPIPFFGAGLIAEIEEEAITAHADPDDRNDDGISGRPNFDRGFVGRFGRKAQTVSIEGFIRGPLFNHAGITTNPLSEELKAALPVPSSITEPPLNGTSRPQAWEPVRHLAQAAAPAEPTVDDDDVPDPELSEQDLFDLVSFSMLLAAPQAEPLTERTTDGRALFQELGCEGCHVEGLNSPRGRIPLYSDLLLHDMGEDRADGVTMGEATGSEFRTQPLWGIAPVGPYLHDGAADTLHEAILLHDGEGRNARNAYDELPESEQALVIEFLESLGGASQLTAGLLPPNAPVPPAGEIGGPDAALSGADLETFLQGRAVFDRDILASEGLGATFNGDSCRACHFDPIIGGAGPSDVDVTRQAIYDSEGNYVGPSGGSMAHRHSVESTRPRADLQANHFELRQTPALFGLGLVDRIAEATLLALEDPDDSDGDGIRGVAHRLSDGRIGRLGWKANVPSLAEFARDGLSNEIGLTVPEQPGLSFGNLTDSDEAPDPEISVAEVEALTFYMSRLAPPPRHSTDSQLEAQGEELFDSVGCATCHVPELQTADGQPVRLYSNLLLHDVLPEGARGIQEGMAGVRAFRTSPLWGLRLTAPYMHDGRAFTIEAAIEAHAGEAATSREAFRELTEAERTALLAFLKSL